MGGLVAMVMDPLCNCLATQIHTLSKHQMFDEDQVMKRNGEENSELGLFHQRSPVERNATEKL